MIVRQVTEHGSDSTQFTQSHLRYPWNLEEYEYLEMEALISEWEESTNLEDRTRAVFEMQELMNSRPPTIVLLYPDQY